MCLTSEYDLTPVNGGKKFLIGFNEHEADLKRTKQNLEKWNYLKTNS